ncbi:uncharacterized protein LOC143740245 isoform X2 [Siphateles boraxobius]
MYAIVEFLEEGTCDLVLQTWLFEEDEVQYCYWPPINVTKKIKRLELPDKKNWTRHRVRVFAKTGDYETAKKWSKRAAVQSSVESSDDVPKRKKRQVCLSSSDEDTSSVPHPKKKNRVNCTTTVEPQLPFPPAFKPNKQTTLTQSRPEDCTILDASLRPAPPRDIQKNGKCKT